MQHRLPTFTRNFYFLFGVFFLVWMTFVDANDIISQVQLSNRLQELRSQKEYYQEQIEQVSQEREALLTNQALLEKFAREEYLMKKPSEDLFIIVEDN